jgi:hypothetical protein
LKRVFLAAAVLATVVAIFVWVELPTKHHVLSSAFSDGTVAGVLHIHSSRSDGRGTPEQIAHEAARAGLKFIVITDHGDGTRTPDPPIYREGVLCLDGTEISTSGGHYIAIDMPASPYPLGGDARDVVEDVKRLGGFGIAAHPDSPKPELKWRDWTAPFDAIEIFNLDTAWRQRVTDTPWRQKAGLFVKLLTYPVRPAESIASLVSRSTVFYRWDALATRRHVVTLAGADAHAQIAWRASDPIHARLSVSVPSYRASFETLSVHVRTERPLTGTAAIDAAMILRGIRAGHLYSVIDGIATPPAFEFTAADERGTVRSGDQLTASGAVTLHVRSNAPDGYQTTIWNGVTAIGPARSDKDFMVTAPAGPGVYWVEIHPDGPLSRVPWLTSNPIYVRGVEAPAVASARPPATTSQALLDTSSSGSWHVVSDPTSLAAMDSVTSSTGDSGLRLRFGLSDGPAANQYAALQVVMPTGIAGFNRLSFDARAERPMRVSVQLQTEKGRWQRSIYIDTFSQPRTIFLDEFVPIGDTATYRAPLADVRNILFVVDAVNTRPGASGRVWIWAPKLEA